MLDLTKVPLNEYGHVQTRDGHPVKLLTITRVGDALPIVGLVSHANGREIIGSWQSDGESWCGHTQDQLVPVPRKVRVTGWLNFYSTARRSVLHATREAANRAANSHRIACVPIDIEVTEGQGL